MKCNAHAEIQVVLLFLQLKLQRTSNTQIKKLYFIHVSTKKDVEGKVESHPKPPRHYLHIALTVVVTVHNGKNTKHISLHVCEFPKRTAVRNRKTKVGFSYIFTYMNKTK
jgi:hypothetical protein